MTVYELTAKIVLETGTFDAEVRNAEIRAENLEDSFYDLAAAANETSGSVEELADALEDSGTSADSGAKKINDAGSAFDSSGAKAEGFAEKIASVVTGFAAYAAVKEAVELLSDSAEAIYEMIDGAAQYGDQIHKGAQQLGVDTATYQEWANTFEHSGTDINTAKEALRTLATQIAADNGTFADLGLNLEALRDMDSGGQFTAVMDALANVADPAERMSAAFSIFGDKAQDLMPLINSAAEAGSFTALGQGFRDLGLGISEFQIQQSAMYMDAKTDMEYADKALQAAFASTWMPVVTNLMQRITQLKLDIANFLTSEKEKTLASYTSDGFDMEDFIAAERALTLARMDYQERRAQLADTWHTAEDYQQEEQALSDARFVYEQLLAMKNEHDAKMAAETAAAEAEANRIAEAALDQRVQMYVNAYNQMHDSVRGMFGLFDTYAAPEERQSVADMNAALQSQIDFNNQYKDAMVILQQYADEQGLSIESLSQSIAGSGKEGAEYAIAMAEAIQAGGNDAEQVRSIIENYEALQQTQVDLAATLTNATGALKTALAETGGEVENLRTKLEDLVNDDYTVSVMLAPSLGFLGSFAGAQRKAVGLDFVPENDFPALLHYGEKVLTREEAEAYRSGEPYRAAAEEVQPISIPVNVYLDEEKIGEAMANYQYRRERAMG